MHRSNPVGVEPAHERLLPAWQVSAATIGMLAATALVALFG